MGSDPAIRTSQLAPVRRIAVNREQWQRRAGACRDADAVLLALWGSDERDRDAGFAVRAALQCGDVIEVLELALSADAPIFPSLTPFFPAADRMERAVYDLLGIRAEGGDTRPWLRHAAWPTDRFPLRRDFIEHTDAGPLPEEEYPFVRVEGDGVHEIAVGPVHAGIIEPGHFRFSIVGEKVLRLEEHLGYAHKGIEKRFENFSAIDGHRLAARVSGDSTVAFSWAYCMALEHICNVAAPPRALHLRALALELERIANHIGDLGALGNDAGLAFGLAQFSRLKEDLLRVNAGAFGMRYLLDYVVPGGVLRDIDEASRQALLTHLPLLEEQVRSLRNIYDEHAGLQDRFAACGRVLPALAKQLGLAGLPGRASGQLRDIRCDLRLPPYDRLGVKMASRSDGDVAARVSLRFDEALESMRLCCAILQDLPSGEVRLDLHAIDSSALGIGLVEGWRGPVLIALEAGADRRIRRCHPHDPSWQNWPLLQHAVLGNIVPDFPLVNKSFNLSYSGHDL